MLIANRILFCKMTRDVLLSTDRGALEREYTGGGTHITFKIRRRVVDRVTIDLHFIIFGQIFYNEMDSSYAFRLRRYTYRNLQLKIKKKVIIIINIYIY